LEKILVTGGAGFIASNLIKNSFVVRSINAYPVIKKDYEDHVYTIKKYLDSIINLYPKLNRKFHKWSGGKYV